MWLPGHNLIAKTSIKLYRPERMEGEIVRGRKGAVKSALKCPNRVGERIH